jgi:hypothetical protein
MLVFFNVGFVAGHHQHQYEAVASFFLSHPMHYYSKLINSGFIKILPKNIYILPLWQVS